MSKTKTTLFIVLPILFSAIAGFALLEGMVRRSIGAPLEQMFPVVRVKADAEAGWRMLPNDQHYTYTRLVQLNSLGFRGPEPRANKADNEYRIIALGGSTLYGQGLTDQELMSAVLTEQLNTASLGCQVSVINMGARGYGIRSELAVLNDPGVALDPDHVVLFFYPNDYDILDVEKVYTHYSKYDWYHWDLKGKATEERMSEWRLRQVLRRSAALMWLFDVYRSFDRGTTVEKRILLGQTDEAIQRGMKNVDVALERLVRLSEEHGFSLSLVALPEPSQGRVEFPNELYQSRLAADAERHEIPYFDLLPTLREYADNREGRILIPFDGHYNAAVQHEFAIKVAENLAAEHIECRENHFLTSASD